jgi:ATP-dependent Clp protease protease subunit
MNPSMNLPMPTVIEKTPHGEKYYDLISKHYEHRNVFLVGGVNQGSAFTVIAQLLYLDSVNSNEPINFYISSNGGSIVDGLAILDTMNLIKSPINMIGFGMCASMGAFLLASGKKCPNSTRKALPNLQVMTHQASGGIGGQASDIVISAKQITKLNNRIKEYLVKFTGKTQEEVNAICDRDYYMDAQEAVSIGLVDSILG